MKVDNNNTIAVKNDAKKVFRTLGTCSHTYFYLLNREYGHLKEEEESASDSLAGGIMQKGYQCGMLWGSSLAVGAESYRRYNDMNRATTVAIIATQSLMDSFAEMNKTISCREITRCDFSNKLSFAKYMISGRFLHCFNLAKEWAPQAIERAEEQISSNDFEIPEHALSCASKVAKKIGATDEEMIMVAGFAGGMGLSGDGCGALSASIWMTSLTLGRKIQGKRYFPTQIKELLRVFEQITDSEYLCHKISGCRFKNIEEHSEFVRKGGCGALIDILQNRSKIITAGA